jgi:hypothetical protein
MVGLQMVGLQMVGLQMARFWFFIFRLEIKGCCYKELLMRGNNYLFKK